MAGIKISALPAATTPLTGAELVAVVQGGATKQTTVLLTAPNLTGPVTSVGPATAIVGPIAVASIWATATGYKFPDATIQATAAIVATGTYTPVRTFDGTGNMASAVPGPANYFRVGNMVTVSGSVTVRTSVYPGVMRFFLSLPIASIIAGVSNAVFGTFCGNTTLQLGAVLNSTANNLAWFCGDTIASTQAGTVNIYYTYVYKII